VNSKRIQNTRASVCLSALLVASCVFSHDVVAQDIELGERPVDLLETLEAGELRSKLLACASETSVRTEFSIAHRGAPLGFPEHTKEGYNAAAKMGAGIIECDVTFTRDKTLVCRHSQCDLASTTNILETPLAEKCSVPPDYSSSTPFSEVMCCTSDLLVDEFLSLRGKTDHGNKDAGTLDEYYSLADTPQSDLQGKTGTLMTHAESIELFVELGVKMIPELKRPEVEMPFNDEYTQEQYAQALVDEYIDAGINPSEVFLQSFSLDDVHYWLRKAPEFGRQSAWLDGRFDTDPSKPVALEPSMADLAETGISIVAPPLWMLLSLDANMNIIPSNYALAAKSAGLDIIAWTAERSGSLKQGGGWYYKSIQSAIKEDGDLYKVLDTLAQQIEVRGVFSDWPATTTFYANCADI